MTVTATPSPTVGQQRRHPQERGIWIWSGRHPLVPAPSFLLSSAILPSSRAPWQLFQEEYDIFRREMMSNATWQSTAVQRKRQRRIPGRKVCCLSLGGGSGTVGLRPGAGRGLSAGCPGGKLTWNHANILSGSNAEEKRGLSEQGKAFVRR